MKNLAKFSIAELAALRRVGVISADEVTTAIKGRDLGPEDLHNLVISGGITINQARDAIGLACIPA